MAQRLTSIPVGEVRDIRRVTQAVDTIISRMVQSSTDVPTVDNAIVITQAEYDALVQADATTVYFTSDTARIYVGGTQFATAPSSAPDVNALQSVVAGSRQSFAHGLGNYPSRIDIFLLCVIAQLGFAAGEMIPIGSSLANYAEPSTTNYRGVTYSFDDQFVHFNVAAQGLMVVNQAGLQSPLTSANWRFNIQAWA